MKAEYVPLEKRVGDLCVVNSARVSFAKMHDCIIPHDDPRREEGQTGDDRLIKYLAKYDHWSPFAHAQMCFRLRFREVDYINWAKRDGAPGLRLVPSFENQDTVFVSGSLYGFAQNLELFPPVAQQYICSYLHRTYPISASALGVPKVEMTYSLPEASICDPIQVFSIETSAGNDRVERLPTHTFKVTAPIFVARQLVKHQVDLVWNEESRRYIDLPPEFYRPDTWRAKPDGSIKQGSGGEVGTHEELSDWVAETTGGLSIEDVITASDEVYRTLMDRLNVAPEQARMVLPQSMEVSWWWTGTLGAFRRVIRDRTAPNAQKETRIIAEQIHEGLCANASGGWS